MLTAPFATIFQESRQRILMLFLKGAKQSPSEKNISRYYEMNGVVLSMISSRSETVEPLHRLFCSRYELSLGVT